MTDGQEGAARRFGRLARWIFAGLALLVVAAAIAVWAIGPRRLAGFAIRGAAELADAGPIRFEITEAGWRRLAAERVGIGADESIRAGRIVVEFGVFGPFGGIRAAEIAGLRVERTLSAGDAAHGDGGGATPAFLPDFPVTLRDAELTLIGPRETYSAASKGTVIFNGEGGSGAFDLAITPRGDAQGGFMQHRGSLALSSVGTANSAITLSLAPAGAPMPGKAHGTVFARIEQGAATDEASLALGLRDVALPVIGAALKTLELKGQARLSDRRLRLALADCARIEGLVTGRLEAERLPVCPLDGPVLTFALDGKDDALAFDFQMRDARGRYLDHAGEALIAGTLPDVTVSGHGDAALSSWQGAFAAEGGRLHWDASFALAAVKLKGEAAMADGQLTHLDATLAQAELSDPRAKPLIVPMTLSGTGKMENGIVALAANAATAGIANLLQADGRYDLSSGSGKAAVKLAPLSFDPAGLKPEALSPALAGQASEVKGRIAADGRFSWSAEGMTSEGTLALERLAARLPIATIQGLDGRIDFSSLLPVATRKPQSLRVALLDIGLPLTDGHISLSVDPSGDTRVHLAQWNWLGGKVGLSSAVLSPFRAAQSLTFAIDSIDLAQLLKLADVKGLSGTGKLSGRIPVTLESGRQPVHDGRLSADPPGGTIVYKAGGFKTGSPTEPSAILYTALDDFRYDRLTAEIGGDLAGELSLKVHLKGHNPQLYDGRRIELNVSTAGPFVDMLRTGIYGYRGAVAPQ